MRPTIDVWCLACDQVSVEDLDHGRRWLAADERAHQARYLFERDRRLHALGRMLLRAGLSRRGARRPEQWRFAVDTNGRPVLASRDPWVFSLSHTEGAVVCAIGESLELGVDVERPGGRHSWRDILPVAFTAAEQARLGALPPAALAERACTLWTLKEAYAKGRGLGLALPFARIGFEVDGESIRFEPAADLEPEPARWSFLRIDVTPEHRAAVCWTGHAEVRIERVASPLELFAG
jgi:4'-phosphopantetheinyl transferase